MNSTTAPTVIPIVATAIGAITALLSIVIGILLYSGRTFRIVKSRGLIHLQFLVWSAIFVGVYTVVVTVVDFWSSAAATTSVFWFMWVIINLRRWAVTFALMSLLMFQVLLGSMRLPGRSGGCGACDRCGGYLPKFQVEHPDQMGGVLRRTVLVLVALYTPVFIIGVVSPLLVEIVSIIIYIIHLLVLISVLITIHIYVRFNWIIASYYSHKYTNVGLLIITDLAILTWVVILCEASWVPTATTQSLDAIFDCVLCLVWMVFYTSQAIIALVAKLAGYPAMITQYENYSISSGVGSPRHSRVGEPSRRPLDPTDVNIAQLRDIRNVRFSTDGGYGTQITQLDAELELVSTERPPSGFNADPVELQDLRKIIQTKTLSGNVLLALVPD